MNTRTELEAGPRPELLAPAGDWECLRAAVANGADAVYFGLSKFNARHRAANFTPQELPEATHCIRAIAEAGADAMIVQDVGLARLAHRLAPGLALHGSTQMTLTEARGVDWVAGLGI